MIYGAIDEKSRRCYTYLKEIFDAISNKQMEYNWLITDSEIYTSVEELSRLETADYSFISGEELTEIVTNDDSQWIWGVLSGFDKCIPKEEILKYPLPKADGYPGFWKNPLTIQHELASIEIVPFDSYLVLLFSKEKEIVDCFRKAFPKSRDLSEYNTEVELQS